MTTLAEQYAYFVTIRKLRPTTRANYSHSWKHLASLGDIELASITKQQIRLMIAQLDKGWCRPGSYQ
jgi:hypothetical protein